MGIDRVSSSWSMAAKQSQAVRDPTQPTALRTRALQKNEHGRENETKSGAKPAAGLGLSGQLQATSRARWPSAARAVLAPVPQEQGVGDDRVPAAGDRSHQPGKLVPSGMQCVVCFILVFVAKLRALPPSFFFELTDLPYPRFFCGGKECLRIDSCMHAPDATSIPASSPINPLNG